MSLINRMLDELAARQAPGTESLEGVRLGQPLEGARTGLDRGRLALLALVIAAVGALVWWRWPGRVAIPVPQARPAPAPATLAAPAAEPALRAGPPAAGPAASTTATTETASFRMPPEPRLQLAERLAAVPPVDRAPFVGTAAERDDAEDVERLQKAPERPRAPAARPATRAAPDDAPARSTPAPPPPADAEPRRTARPVARAAPAVDPDAERRQRARRALADQDPASALASVSADDAARDVESAALRAAALQRLGRHGEAADLYAGLTARDAAEPGHWVGLAISLEADRRREAARIAYRRALQSDRLAPSLRAFAQDRVTVLESP